MYKEKKLLKNSGLFAISTFGSKILSFLMVPLYSHVLTTAEFGTVDIYLTILNLLIPIVSLSIFDAVFRFAMDRSELSGVVFFETGFSFSALSSVVFAALSLLAITVFNFPFTNSVILVIIIIFQLFISLFQQFARAIDQVAVFSISGLIYTFTYLLCNIFLLVIYRFGVTGYLVSYLVACLVTIVFLGIALLPKVYKAQKPSLSLKHLKPMLAYCIPLIPNAVLLWIITASARFFILYFCGVESNGLYAAANKIPLILSLFTSVFFQAWQLSAIEETAEPNSDFSRRIINGLIALASVGASAVLLCSKFVITVFFDVQYADAWKYVPFLLLSIIFQCYSSFYGTIYMAYKKTLSVMITSIFGALINIVGNFLLVPVYGVQGACFTTMLAFLVMWLIRLFHTRKIYRVDPHYPLLILSSVLIVGQAVLRILVDNILLQWICFALLITVTFVLNRSVIKTLLAILKKKR